LSNKEKADTRAYAEHVYLWFGVDGAELIDPGILTAKAFVKEKFKDYKHQLAAMSEGLQLPENCRVCSATDGSLFAVEIRYGNSNPLDACLQPIALLLLKLRDEELNLPGRPQNLARQLCPEPAG
jgi:hypothetical protein